MRTLTLGDRGKEVSDVQKRLHALGYELGNEGLDGFLGPASQLALRAFQQQRGLLADGILGPNTWHELVEAGYGLGDRLLYLRVPNFRGDDVLALQVKLNLLGFNAGPERGIFDTAVERALIDFQRNAGLPSDGIVGDDTLRKLDALRKAESGREGKKIPDRDEGFVAATSLAGTVIAIDPGHGGQDAGVISPSGRKEKDLTLACRPASGRAAACRGQPGGHDPRDRPDRAALRAHRLGRDGGAPTTSSRCISTPTPVPRRPAPSATSSSAATTTPSTARACPTTSAPRSAGSPSGGFIGSLGRNFAVLREPTGIAVMIEPLFLSNPADDARAGRAEYVERLARAVVAGFARYLARA